MEVELNTEKDKESSIEVGDAIVFKDDTIRIIVNRGAMYCAYAPEQNHIYGGHATSIDKLIAMYDKNNIKRIIKKDCLKIVEI